MSDLTNQSDNYDAQQVVEEIEGGDRKAPTANVEADYAAAQEFSTSAIDQTEEGSHAAEAATTSERELPAPDESLTNTSVTSSPETYKQMANDLGSTPEGFSGTSTDDLYQKALEKGKPGS